MKLGVLADIHLGIAPYGLEIRKKDIYQSFLDALEMLSDVDLLILAGDILDKKQVDFETIKVLSELKKFKDRLFCVDGNHDGGLRELLSSFVKFDKALTFDLGKWVLFGLDYKKEHRLLAKEIDEFDAQGKNSILVGHFNLHELMPYLKSEDSYLSLAELKKFTLVLNGHLHAKWRKENYVSIPTLESLKANLPCGEFYVIRLNDGFYTIEERRIEVRKVCRTKQKDEVLTLLNENLSPIVFFVGTLFDFTEKELAMIKDKCLLFKVEKDVDAVIETLKTDVATISTSNVKQIFLDYFNQAGVCERLKSIFLENFSDVRGAEEALHKFVWEFTDEALDKDFNTQKENTKDFAFPVSG